MAKAPNYKSIVFFNNKGGVGKTTLACNMAAHIAAEAGLEILVVDLDPQCNATQLLLDDEVWSTIYGNRKESSKRTIMKVLKKIQRGDSGIDDDLDIYESDRFGVDVLPGHPSLSMLEDRLSSSWGEFQQGYVGGARRSLWVAELVSAAAYDLVLFDVGPSLGALNRTALVGSEGYVTPMSADLFSLYALDNIYEWTRSWAKEYARARDAVAERNVDEDLEWIDESPKILNGFVGYTVQQYVTKTKAGNLRKVKAYEQYSKQIPDRAESLASRVGSQLNGGPPDLHLGVVPNMFSMVPLAQAVHAPIRSLTPSDGVRGAQVSQRERYVERLDVIAARLMKNIGL